MSDQPDYQALREYLYNTGMQGALQSIRLPNRSLPRKFGDLLFGNFLSNVIDTGLTYDRLIGERSMAEACEWLSLRLGSPPVVKGVENIPVTGPALLVSNHPGYYEGFAVLSQLPRDDLKVIAGGGIPYFNELPNTQKFIYYTDHSAPAQVRVLRQAVRHLRSGGILLIFPTGQADPDPDVMEGAEQSITTWSESVALMLRQVKDIQLVPTITSGIIRGKYLRHPFARMQKKPRLRIRAAGLFQMLDQFKREGVPPISRPRISFGKPVSGKELMERAGGPEIMPLVIEEAQSLLRAHMSSRAG